MPRNSINFLQVSGFRLSKLIYCKSPTEVAIAECWLVCYTHSTKFTSQGNYLYENDKLRTIDAPPPPRLNFVSRLHKLAKMKNIQSMPIEHRTAIDSMNDRNFHFMNAFENKEFSQNKKKKTQKQKPNHFITLTKQNKTKRKRLKSS